MVAGKKTRGWHGIPDYLIREMIGGQSFYYKGYKDVVSGGKAFEAIIGSSMLQGLLSTYVTIVCIKEKLHERYEMLTGNPGLSIDADNQLICNTLLFEPTVLTPDRISAHCVEVVPKIAFIIDDKVEVTANLHNLYLNKKIETLHQFGTEKVIWVLTATKQVIVAIQNQPSLTYNWNEDIELLDGVTFNIGTYLKAKGVKLPD